MRVFGLSRANKAMLIVWAIIPGCTFVYTDPVGNDRIVGLADVEITAMDNPRGSLAGHLIIVNSLGIIVDTSRDKSGFVIGYTKIAMVDLQNCGLFNFTSAPSASSKSQSVEYDAGLSVARSLPDNGAGYFGLVNITIPGSGRAGSVAGNLQAHVIIGLSIAELPQGTEFVIGYSSSTMAAINNDVLVIPNFANVDCNTFEPIIRQVKQGKF